ncbi:hypothetical protein [Lysobacter silvisoli]|uniref:hypothetical protein n=1 Tax=Lysobacter silvisoli TaxID=2293254 RepID=UPI0011C0611B|nr:hypothetical protein [Lysobacter silvisoli]
MELSTIADILGVLGGVVLIIGGLWRFARTLRRRIAETRQASEQGRALARELASRATNPERRADIHAYLTLRAIEFEGDRTRSAVFMGVASILTIGMTLVTTLLLRSSQVSWTNPWALALIATVVFLYLSIGMLLFYSRELHQLQDGWQQGAMDAIGAKIDKHLSD